jgi:hypothetical protein
MRYTIFRWLMRNVMRRIDPQTYGECLGMLYNALNRADNLYDSDEELGIECRQLAFTVIKTVGPMTRLMNYHKDL